ncbi:hypothetical protein SAY87_020147 [Trapa incisa]|uniref:Retrotransposon gag domain-containing protein n=1 Tax=Trapa incisa TaxID=236973 RepID=A0AAN7K315_9MYRT|nr:hypothetical protein SAY87_020147 [Trapa incisa]
MTIIKTTSQVLRGARRDRELQGAANLVIEAILMDSSELENMMATKTNSRVSGLIGIGYYEDESSASLVQQSTAQNLRREQLSLWENVGWFQGGGDMVEEHAYRLALLEQGNETVAAYAREFMQLQCFALQWVLPNITCK